jgi:hypothetical protein
VYVGVAKTMLGAMDGAAGSSSGSHAKNPADNAVKEIIKNKNLNVFILIKIKKLVISKIILLR